MDAMPIAAPSRQKLMGERVRAETGRRLLEAAGAEFAARGYSRATVGSISLRAGTTVQTLYAAWGSKRALLRAHLHARLSDGEQYPDVLLARVASRDPQGLLDEIAVIMGEIAERAAEVWTLYREASAVEPDVRADWDDLQRRRHDTFAQLLAGVPDRALRAGLDRAAAVDTAWAVTGPEMHELLARHAGYSADSYRSWLQRTLRSTLLEDVAGDSAATRPGMAPTTRRRDGGSPGRSAR